MDQLRNFFKRNKTLVIVALAVAIGISVGLIYSLNKYANMEAPVSQRGVSSVSVKDTGSVYDKYVENQNRIDKKNGKDVDYNAKRSANNLNETIYAFNDFLLNCHNNIKIDDQLVPDKEIYGILNYDTPEDIKQELANYFVDSDKMLTSIMSNYAIVSVGDRVGVSLEQKPKVYWINKNYQNDVVFSNNNSAEIKVPLYADGSPQVAPSVATQPEPLKDSYGNILGGANANSNDNVNQEIFSLEDYPGRTMTVKLKKEHGSWKITSLKYN